MLPRSFSQSTRLIRSKAVSALIGAALLTTPGLAVYAAQPDGATVHHASTSGKHETVDQRIDGLHKSLKITADEETAWSAVAQAMRDNEAAMQKLIAANNAETAKNVSAIQDLKIYESFTQAHVDGLKNLIAAFETLYTAMPAAQKSLADQVFQRFGHKGTQSAKG